MQQENAPNSRVVYLFIALIGLMYFVFRPVFLVEAEDARIYALAVTGRAGDWMPVPHHLFFEWFHIFFHKIAQFFGFNGDVYSFVQFITVLCSVGVLLTVASIAKRLNLSRNYTLIVLACTAFSYGFWTYSAEGDTYMPTILFTLFCFPLLMKAYAVEKRKLYMVLLGLCSAAATLISQQYVLLLPIIAITLFLGWLIIDKRENFARLFTDVAVFGSVATALIAGSYLGMSFWYFGHENLAETMTYIRGMTSDGLFTDFSLVKTPILVGVGVGRSFFGLNYLFAHPSFSEAVAPLFTGVSFVEEQYAAVQSIGASKVWIYALLTIIGTCSIIFVFTKLFWAGFKKAYLPTTALRTDHLSFLVFAIVFSLIFLLFVILWEPDNIEFYLHLVPIFWLATFYYAQRLPKQKTLQTAVLIFIGSMFTVNFVGSLLPYSNKKNDYWHYANADVMQTLQPNDLFLLACGEACASQLKIEHHAHFLNLECLKPHCVTEIRQAMSNHTSGRIFVSKWLFEPETGHPFLNDFLNDTEAFETNYGDIRPHLKDVRTPKSKTLPDWPKHDFWEYIP